MKKLQAAFQIFLLVLSLAACGKMKSQTVTGGVISANIPSGWCMVIGTEMNGASGSDYICHSKEFVLGDPYLQIMVDTQAEASMN